MNPNELVANAIAREREQAGLSLSALALRAELAKSTLSQLEAGKGNPSIETLWAIASALDVPLSFLFENTTPHSQVIRASEGVELSSDVSGDSAVLLAKCPPAARRDLYRVNMNGGQKRKSRPHPRGTIEHVFISEGVVRLGPLQALETLNPGDYYRFPADTEHTYESLSETARLLIVMESGA
ncbi:MAG: helix-turn-helix domain-containing protein [Pseudomonadota bacterium]